MRISLLCCLFFVLLANRATNVKAQSRKSKVFVTEHSLYNVELQVGSLEVNATISSNFNLLSIVNCSIGHTNLLNATPVACKDSVCSTSNGFICGGSGCAYNLSYEFIARSVPSFGTLYRGSFGPQEGPTLPAIFGCETGEFLTTIYDAPAVLSLNRAPLSFITQIGEGNRVFSYCFPPPTQYNSTGYIVFGKSSFSSAFSTPILVNSIGSPFYYVGLTSISVNGTQLQIPDSAFEIQRAAGGTIVDTVNYLSFLVPSAYGPLKKAIVDAVGSPPLPEVLEGFDLCYNATTNIPDTEVTFTIQGLPPGNITIGKPQLWFKNDTNMCFTIWNASYYVPYNILGTFQLSNLHIELDSDNMMASIGPNVNCT